MALLTSLAFGAQALYGVGKAAGWWGQPKIPGRKRSPLETGYISELERRSKEGIYTPGMQQEVISQVSGRAAEVGARQKADIYGQLSRQGLESSIVSQYATRGTDRDVLTKVSEVAREIALRNQMSKVGAQDVLGGIGLERTRENYQDRYRQYMAQYGAQQQGIQTAFGGLQGAAGAYGDYRQQTDFNTWLQSYSGGNEGTQSSGSDDSFGAAFAKARREGLTEFIWQGGRYNTNIKD